MGESVELKPPTSVGGTWYQSAAAEASKLVAQPPGNGKQGLLHRVRAQNKSAATIYVFVYDGTDATGTPIAGPIPVGAHAAAEMDYPFGIPFTTGLYVALSDSDASYSAHAGTDAWLGVGYHLPVGG